MKFITNRTLILAISIVISGSLSAQDLIARQAPIDKKLKSVDSLALQQQIRAELAAQQAIDIYPDWDNNMIRYNNPVVPDSYKFDLTGFSMPTQNTRITDVFGYRPRRRRMHYGLDIKVAIGDTIVAAFDGKIRIVKNQGRRRGYGKYIVIRHNNGLETVYGHLSKQLVTVDQEIKAGEPIGLGGNTGRSTGSHLHFETRFLGIPIDPALMFDFVKQDIVADTYTFNKAQQVAKNGATVTGGNVYYKVKKGDTLSRIASRQGISIDSLCKLNRITRKSILRPGQVLRCS
ncbi:MAG: peptidoglycan DD-metalloendopeptidase family protein [Prevotellaceae bacterium]|jgi:murein DD-endopeptidase MepM/ murein hydrolase activator NlpD|nr:peptidoglycan DD-metalloendopeptidase family protein [Prevotellaceae bacterium]